MWFFYHKPVSPKMFQISANSVIKILDFIHVSSLCGEKNKENFKVYFISSSQHIFWMKWAQLCPSLNPFWAKQAHCQTVKGTASLSCWVEILSERSCYSGSHRLKGRGHMSLQEAYRKQKNLYNPTKSEYHIFFMCQFFFFFNSHWNSA